MIEGIDEMVENVIQNKSKKHNKYWCECKKQLNQFVYKGNYIWNPSTGACKWGYLNNYCKH